MLERLQKILSARGIASRRKAEEYIVQGLVTVNGTVATLGQKADPEKDIIEVDGKVMQARQEMVYFVMYKPRGVVTTNIEGERAVERSSSVRDLLPPELRGKIYPIGRLDKDSEGLLLFTNDGVLAYRLTHPKFDHEKEYEVTVDGSITDGQLQKIKTGVMLDGVKTKPAKIRRISPETFHIAITEGRNRQIRRMCEKVGTTVTVLKRVRIMTLTDAALMPGKLRSLTRPEVQELLKSVGLG